MAATQTAERKQDASQQRGDVATDLVKKLERSYSQALPSHITMEHFSRALLTEFRRNPTLLECTPESISSGVLTTAQLGLMIGVCGQAWLIPFNNRKRGCKEAVLVIGYQGLIELCYRSDKVESVFADVVCEHDEVEYEQGLNQKLRHKPNLRGSRGKPYAVYAIANIKGSSRPVPVVLSEEEVNTIRSASPGSKKEDSPWNGDFETEMWKKTAVRRLSKYLPKSVELAAALDFETRQAEELKVVDASVVDDPLLPGRHETRRRISKESRDASATRAAQEPAGTSAPASEPAERPDEPAAPESVPEPEPASPADEAAPFDDGFPPEACAEYRELCTYRERSPRLIERSIDAAAKKHDECMRLKSFGDIDHTDTTMCNLVLAQFRFIKDAASGK